MADLPPGPYWSRNVDIVGNCDFDGRPSSSPCRSAPFGNFCEFGSRFGPHNQHQPQHQRTLLLDDATIHMTSFNAGLRIFDISDPLLVRDTGNFVPPVPDRRIGALPRAPASQSEDVPVDAGGIIYVSDKNHGVTVLRQTPRA